MRARAEQTDAAPLAHGADLGRRSCRRLAHTRWTFDARRVIGLTVAKDDALASERDRLPALAAANTGMSFAGVVLERRSCMTRRHGVEAQDGPPGVRARRTLPPGADDADLRFQRADRFQDAFEIESSPAGDARDAQRIGRENARDRGAVPARPTRLRHQAHRIRSSGAPLTPSGQRDVPPRSSHGVPWRYGSLCDIAEARVVSTSSSVGLADGRQQYIAG
jgi:hypothetical protein